MSLAFRRSDIADLPALMALWQETFGDPPAFTERFYANFGADCAIVAKEDGKIVAMIHPLPIALAQNARYAFGIYIYALATAPDYRGRGIASRLLELAESAPFPASPTLAGACEIGLRESPVSHPAFSLLIPGEESLFTYYRKKGYLLEAQVVSREPSDYPAYLRQGTGSEPIFLKPEPFYSFAQKIPEPTPPPMERALWKPLVQEFPEREPILSHFMQ